MAYTKFFLVALLFATAVLAQTETKRIIDEFTVDQGPFVVITGNGPQSHTDTTDDDGSNTIIGEERDYFFEVIGVTTNNLVFSTGVSSGAFTGAVPSASQAGNLGNVVLTWDGDDNAGNTLDPSGLGGIDFTSNLANQFHGSGFADFTFDAEIRVYSGSAGNFCTASVTIPGGTINTDFFVDFTEFTNVGSGCSFTNVGAVQLLVGLTDNLDFSLDFLRTLGPIPATPSTTPSLSSTPTTTISASRTPSPNPSAPPTPSQTPSQTPTVTPVDERCVCECPAFRCELFRSDDEDGGIIGYRSVSDDYWNWYGFPSSVLYGVFSTVFLA